MTIEVQRIEPLDEEMVEEWTRTTNEEHILGVSALRNEDDAWSWQVSIHVAEYVREEPLQTHLHDAVTAALKAVAGVTDAAQEDREVWVVDGTPTGEALVRAAGAAVDTLADETRKVYARLQPPMTV